MYIHCGFALTTFQTSARGFNLNRPKTLNEIVKLVILLSYNE